MALDVIPLVTSLTPLRWLVPSDDSLAFSWTHPGYDDSLWEQAVAPIGFDERDPPALIDEIKTSVADRMRGQNAGAFLRIPFDLSAATPRNLTLRVRYNDGFVAFLNGREIVRRNARSPIGWNTGALSRRSLAQVRRFEHIDISEHRDFLEPGSNLLAIQALNQSANDADFFFVAELDGLEVRRVDTPTSGYLEQQTPGWPNGGAFDGLLAPPSFSHASRILTEPISLELIANAMTTEIRYTLDGSTPDEFSPIYTEPIRVDANADVRARAFGPGRLQSATSQRVFMMLDADLADWNSDLPIVVVDASGVIPQNFIFSHLFVLDRGADGRVALTDPVSFAGDIGVKVRGNSTTGRPKKTYGVEIRNERGTDRTAEILGMPTDSDWVLYGAFNNDLALMRNAYMYELSNQVGLYAPRTRFCEVFVNSGGSTLSAEGYAGVYSIMEKIKASPQRVDIQELDSDDLTPPNVTGSYMMKIDDLDPGDAGFFAANQRLAYVEPKEPVIKIRPEQVAWIRDYIDAFGVSLEATDVTSPDVPIEQKTYAD
ncbi:MAG: CotH kinase family protein, partial [Planctomycetes bacterium]|nr:CotH kinase family protein [Planctomycetota bacterium]